MPRLVSDPFFHVLPLVSFPGSLLGTKTFVPLFSRSVRAGANLCTVVEDRRCDDVGLYANECW